tara:strand:+ start:1159 stop:2082 length:924 start_codon:yes stop_codon:yes gene_type:complete
MFDRQTANSKFRLIEAALHFFVVAAKNPAGFVWLSLMSVLFFGVVMGLSLAITLPMAAAGADSQPEDMGRLFLWIPVLFVAALLFAVSLCGAWARFLIFGINKPGIPFRLGGDEWRIVVVGIVVSVVMMAVQFAVMLIAMIPMMVVMGIASSSGSEDTMESIMWIMPLLIYVPILALSVYFTVRLYPAFAMSIIHRQIITFEAWKATNSVFWPAAGAVILSGVLAILVYFAVLGLTYFTPVFPWMEGEVPQIASTTDMVGWIWPGIVLGMALFSIVLIWVCAIPFGPIAYIALRHKRILDTPDDGNG